MFPFSCAEMWELEGGDGAASAPRGGSIKPSGGGGLRGARGTLLADSVIIRDGTEPEIKARMGW